MSGNYKCRMLDLPQDVAWLFDTHLADLHTGKVGSVALYGNEDCPAVAVLYNETQPDVDTTPIAVVIFPEAYGDFRDLLQGGE